MSRERPLERSRMQSEALLRAGDEALQADCVEIALHCYDQAARLDGSETAIGLKAARALRRFEHTTEAIDILNAIVARNPESVAVRMELADALADVGELKAGIDTLKGALPHTADSIDLLTQLATRCHEDDDLEQAEEYFARCTRVAPTFFGGHSNLGTFLVQIGRPAEAIDAFSRAIELEPKHAATWKNLGNAWYELGEFETALTHFNQAIELQSDFPAARFDRSLVLLALGEKSRGWAEYSFRFAAGRAEARHPELPRWDGTRLHGGRLLVTSEQGVGDQIMFSRCLGEFLQRFAHAGIECDIRLRTLFRRSFPNTEIVKESRVDLSERFQTQIPLGSLPQFSRPSANRPLSPKPGLVKLWRKRLSQIGQAPKVAISWRGGSDAVEARKRSIALREWRALFGVRDVTFVNLQRGEIEGDLIEANRDFACRLLTWDDVDLNDDFENAAAIAAASDLVITVDNTIAHLAGALHQRTWTLLPRNCDWRWGATGSKTDWYPRMELYRQETLGDWSSLLGQVAKRLERWRDER